MIPGKFNIVMDSAWGSSGKGKVAAWLAKHYGVTDASSCNMPNAGHTVQDGGQRWVYKVLPAASHYGARAWLGPSSVFSAEQFRKEEDFDRNNVVTRVHPRAMMLRPEHAEEERATLSKISSTMQGSGAAACEKMMRKAPLQNEDTSYWRAQYLRAVRDGVALHEVAQGWGLSLNHGTHYPHCTSRDCGAMNAAADMAIPASLVGDVYLVVRTFPIRVGNTADGYSGGWLDDQEETTWEAIEAATGLSGLAEKERTTVTKRIRRVATFSNKLLRDAALHNGATKIVVTFPEYLDAQAAGIRGHWHNNILPRKVRDFVAMVESVSDVPVVGVSTGPETDDMVWL